MEEVMTTEKNLMGEIKPSQRALVSAQRGWAPPETPRLALGNKKRRNGQSRAALISGQAAISRYTGKCRCSILGQTCGRRHRLRCKSPCHLCSRGGLQKLRICSRGRRMEWE